MADILCVCGDPGPAAAVAPVAAVLQRRGHAVRVIATDAAQPMFARAGFSTVTVPTPFSQHADAHRAEAQVVLAGSSWRERSELPLVASARNAKTPSLVVLDYWSHYEERFTMPDGSMLFPDRIAVMDARARDGMLAAGCPPERVVVTGAPQFDALLTTRDEEIKSGTIDAVRSAAGVAAGDLLVLFVSQPIERQLGRRLGYTEDEVLEALIDALGAIAGGIGRRITLGIRRHPLETATGAARSQQQIAVIELPGSFSRVACLMGADLIVGMNSALLIEAALLGRRTISFQPGLAVPDSLWTNETGATTPVYDRGSIATALARALDNPNDGPSPRGVALPIGHAADRVADELLGLLNQEN